ncbi:unnamed protein product [Calicophoron daubneyi]|uniref:Uncharacterized protein n=1 Tax=Calicophoron daubneyi TaxID=300641 RepID=A0AAV2TV73_CALDB
MDKEDPHLLYLLRLLNLRIKKAERERDCALRKVEQLQMILRSSFILQESQRTDKENGSVTPTRRSCIPSFDSGHFSSDPVRDEPCAASVQRTDASYEGRASSSHRALTLEVTDKTSFDVKSKESKNVNSLYFDTVNNNVHSRSTISVEPDISGDALPPFLPSDSSRTDPSSLKGSVNLSSGRFSEALPISNSILHRLPGPFMGQGEEDVQCPLQTDEACQTVPLSYISTALAAPASPSEDAKKGQIRPRCSSTAAETQRFMGLKATQENRIFPISSRSGGSTFFSPARLTVDGCARHGCSGFHLPTWRSRNINPIVDDQYISELERECRAKALELSSTSATLGVVSRAWLQQLIVRLEQLSEACKIRQSTARASSCIPSAGCNPITSNKTEEKPQTDCADAKTPGCCKTSKIPKLKEDKGLQTSCRKVLQSRDILNRTRYPLFLPVDNACDDDSSEYRAPLWKPSYQHLVRTQSIHNDISLTRKTPCSKKSSTTAANTSHYPKCGHWPIGVEVVTTVKRLSRKDSKVASGPRILITDPAGMPITPSKCAPSAPNVCRVMGITPTSLPRVAWR